jgi:hypothetical protein
LHPIINDISKDLERKLRQVVHKHMALNAICGILASAKYEQSVLAARYEQSVFL